MELACALNCIVNCQMVTSSTLTCPQKKGCAKACWAVSLCWGFTTNSRWIWGKRRIKIYNGAQKFSTQTQLIVNCKFDTKGSWYLQLLERLEGKNCKKISKLSSEVLIFFNILNLRKEVKASEIFTNEF